MSGGAKNGRPKVVLTAGHTESSWARQAKQDVAQAKRHRVQVDQRRDLPGLPSFEARCSCGWRTQRGSDLTRAEAKQASERHMRKMKAAAAKARKAMSAASAGRRAGL